MRDTSGAIPSLQGHPLCRWGASEEGAWTVAANPASDHMQPRAGEHVILHNDDTTTPTWAAATSTTSASPTPRRAPGLGSTVMSA